MISRLKKNDLVEIVSGKDKGKRGQIIAVDRLAGKVKVRGINLVTRHVKPKASNEKGRIVRDEAYMFACKVMPICPESDKPCRIRVLVNKETNERARVSHRSGVAF